MRGSCPSGGTDRDHAIRPQAAWTTGGGGDRSGTSTSTGRSSLRVRPRPSGRTRNTRWSAPVHLVMDVHKDGEAYRVTGTVRDAAAAGVRALPGTVRDPGRQPVRAPLRAGSRGRRRKGRSGKSTEDDLTTAFYKEESIDLGELMHEQFVLALPMKPLCAEACKGLCVHCGTNLNKGTCDCAPTVDRSTAGRAQESDQDREGELERHAESKTPALEDPHRQAPHPRRAEAGRPRPVSAVPGSEAAAHVVCSNCGYYNGRQVKAVEE